MPKAAMTIAQLEQYLEKQKSRFKNLREKRERLLADIAKLDEQIASLVGSTAPAPEKIRRPQKKTRPVQKKAGKTLRETVLEILKASPQPMTTKEIAEAVTKSGYKSTSKNFLALVRLFCYKSDELQRKSKGKFALKRKK